MLITVCNLIRKLSKFQKYSAYSSKIVQWFSIAGNELSMFGHLDPTTLVVP